MCDISETCRDLHECWQLLVADGDLPQVYEVHQGGQFLEPEYQLSSVFSRIVKV